jgi:hypothetical protein
MLPIDISIILITTTTNLKQLLFVKNTSSMLHISIPPTRIRSIITTLSNITMTPYYHLLKNTPKVANLFFSINKLSISP